MADVGLIAEFKENRLRINNKKQKVTQGKREKARLTLRKWKEVAANLNPQDLRGLRIESVNLGECCKELFTLIRLSTNCTQLLLGNASDYTNTNSCLSQCLSESLKHLHKLSEIDIRDTELGDGWGDVLYSISSPDLRVLSLIRTKLRGHGEALMCAISRLHQLLFLQINNSGLCKDELIPVFSLLPKRFPHLQALLMAGHDISIGGSKLVNMIKGLPRLRLLNVDNCMLQKFMLSKIILKVPKAIEILILDRNNALTGSNEELFAKLMKCRHLQYLGVSSYQLTKEETDRLITLLSHHGGHLLMDVSSNDQGWKNCIGQLDRIRDECLSF